MRSKINCYLYIIAFVTYNFHYASGLDKKKAHASVSKEKMPKIRICEVKPIETIKNDGDKGHKGDKGLDSPIGPPGLPGMPGVCPCVLEIIKSHQSLDDESMGSDQYPMRSTCQTEDIREGEFYFASPSSSFKAHCNVDKETCIFKNNIISINNQKKTEAFWLSEIGIEMRNITGLETDQILWLQENTISARQTIKYRCKNSTPVPKDGVSKPVEFLTWNDVVIGPSPTSITPLTYVLETEDLCSKALKDVWAETTITIGATNENRLPIVDIRFNNGLNTNQEIEIENVELCFK